jgi:hypothetical protein
MEISSGRQRHSHSSERHPFGNAFSVLHFGATVFGGALVRIGVEVLANLALVGLARFLQAS